MGLAGVPRDDRGPREAGAVLPAGAGGDPDHDLGADAECLYPAASLKRLGEEPSRGRRRWQGHGGVRARG